MSIERTNAVPGIDLSYRPASYFWPMGVEKHLLARIKGAERKRAVEQLLAAGRPDDLVAFLGRSALDEDERRAIGRMHPCFMGGEYLPNLAEDEVEIARITIASVTQDVTSIFARRGKHRIHYRIVDEYEGETLSGKTERTSTRPLTLGELEKFFDGAWSIYEVLEMNFAEDGYDPDAVLAFTSPSSQFYPQFGSLYEARIAAWAAERRAEWELNYGETADTDDPR